MSDMSGKFEENSEAGTSAAVPAPITQESPNLTAAGNAIRSVLESLVVSPAAGGEPGTLSLGEGNSRIVVEGNQGTFIYSVPVAALGSISTDVIETSLIAELKKHAFFKEKYDLTKDMAWKGNYVKDAANLITEITNDSSVTIPDNVKQRLQGWAERQGRENAGKAFYISNHAAGEEDNHNRVIYSIETYGKSPADDAIAAKDFVTTNIQARKDDILKAVIAAASEADAKHIAEQGTPLFTPEEKAKLNPENIGKVGGLDLAIEDSSHGEFGRVVLFLGTRKEIAAQCKDLPKDQLDATPLSKLSDDVRLKIINTAVRTAGDRAEDIYSIVAGADVALKELHDVLGGKESAYHDRIELLCKAAKESNRDWRTIDAERQKTPHIAVTMPFGKDGKNIIDISIPAPDGVKTEALLEGIASVKANEKPKDELSAFIGQSKAGKKHHDAMGLAEGEPKPGDVEPGEEPKPDNELKAKLAPSTARKPVLGLEANAETIVSSGTVPGDPKQPDAVISDAVLAERTATPKVPGGRAAV